MLGKLIRPTGVMSSVPQALDVATLSALPVCNTDIARLHKQEGLSNVNLNMVLPGHGTVLSICC